jgi:hypothetical protein
MEETLQTKDWFYRQLCTVKSIEVTNAFLLMRHFCPDRVPKSFYDFKKALCLQLFSRFADRHESELELYPGGHTGKYAFMQDMKSHHYWLKFPHHGFSFSYFSDVFKLRSFIFISGRYDPAFNVFLWGRKRETQKSCCVCGLDCSYYCSCDPTEVCLFLKICIYHT